MANSAPTLVDPPAPYDGAFGLIFEADTFSNTALYALGDSYARPLYTIASDKNITHSTLTREAALAEGGEPEVVGRTTFAGKMKGAITQKIGTVAIGGGAGDSEGVVVPIERWLMPKSVEVGVVGMAVRVREREYVWLARTPEAARGYTVYDCIDQVDRVVATYEPSHAERASDTAGTEGDNWNVVRAHVVFHLSELGDDKAVPELLLSLVVWEQLQQRLRKGARTHTPGKVDKTAAEGSGLAVLMGLLICVVQ